MNDTQPADALPPEDKPPFLYEIRVKGRLSNERWTAWFDESTVTTKKGDTTLRGSVPDHSGLYGLLGKLRDLAVPLVSVRVLDAEAQRKIGRQARRLEVMIHLTMTLIYLLLLGGLIALTVFAAGYIHTALALMLLFAAMAGLAHAFGMWNSLPIWQGVAYTGWIACAVSLIVLVGTSGLMHPALTVAASLFLAAAAMVYLVSFLRRRVQSARDSLVDAHPARGSGTGADPAQSGKGASQGASDESAQPPVASIAPSDDSVALPGA